MTCGNPVSGAFPSAAPERMRIHPRKWHPKWQKAVASRPLHVAVAKTTPCSDAASGT